MEVNIHNQINGKNSSSIKSKIKNKWNKVNDMNGLDSVMYDDNTETLYLMYEYGACIVNKQNSITREVDNAQILNIALKMNKANTDNDDNTIYMKVDEFKNFIK